MENPPFFVEVEATGIDPFDDRVTEIFAINTHSLSEFHVTTKPLGAALSQLFDWLESQKKVQAEPTVLVANQGHYFVFPLLTREIRRSRTDIKHAYQLWDLVYTYHKRRKHPTPEGTVRERAHGHLSNFREITGHDMCSKPGFDTLSQDNREYTQRNPQPVVRTKHLRVN